MNSLAIDPRILNLSYSSNVTLHSCPRKFQLYKLQAQESGDEDIEQSLTFAFGHAVGTGVQLMLTGHTLEEVIWRTFIAWPVSLIEENKKQNKSFYKAIHALKLFAIIRNSSLLRDYELVTYNGEPACELSFRINFPDGFKYRGFVDAVLKHKVTGKILVLEIKTTSATWLREAQYKNSAQAIGYSIVLDHIFPGYSSYDVLYLPYLTKSMEFEHMIFTKSALQRALWLQELLLDIETIKLYESVGVYPMRGESCFSFNRECGYFGTCTLSTVHLTAPLTESDLEKLAERESKYAIDVSFADLLTTQLEKAQ